MSAQVRVLVGPPIQHDKDIASSHQALRAKRRTRNCRSLVASQAPWSAGACSRFRLAEARFRQQRQQAGARQGVPARRDAIPAAAGFALHSTCIVDDMTANLSPWYTEANRRSPYSRRDWDENDTRSPLSHRRLSGAEQGERRFESVVSGRCRTSTARSHFLRRRASIPSRHKSTAR